MEEKEDPGTLCISAGNAAEGSPQERVAEYPEVSRTPCNAAIPLLDLSQDASIRTEKAGTGLFTATLPREVLGHKTHPLGGCSGHEVSTLQRRTKG